MIPLSGGGGPTPLDAACTQQPVNTVAAREHPVLAKCFLFLELLKYNTFLPSFRGVTDTMKNTQSF